MRASPYRAGQFPRGLPTRLVQISALPAPATRFMVQPEYASSRGPAGLELRSLPMRSPRVTRTMLRPTSVLYPPLVSV